MVIRNSKIREGTVSRSAQLPFIGAGRGGGFRRGKVSIERLSGTPLGGLHMQI